VRESEKRCNGTNLKIMTFSFFLHFHFSFFSIFLSFFIGMGIQQLSQVTIRSISSGPVITSIGSVVKELVE